MTTTVKALQTLSVNTMQGDQALDRFMVESGETFDLLTGTNYRTGVRPALLEADEALVHYGHGSGDPRAALARIERHEDHMAAGGDINAGPYGKLYE